MKYPVELYFLFFLHLLLSLNALIGGGAMILQPDGSLLKMQPGWLEHTPFQTYLIPGMILFICNGLFPLLALAGLWVKPKWSWANVLNIYADKYWAWTYSLFTGIILITW